MKRFFLALTILSLLSFHFYGKETLSFKGIPISGSLSSFCKQLKEKGFTLIDSSEKAAIFDGYFVGAPANVLVVTTDNSDIVYAVMVQFSESDNWNTLVSSYNHYKDLYSEKYGEPLSIEHNPATGKSNSSLMFELQEGNVDYICKFETSGGDISIIIQSGEKYLNGRVSIIYQDSNNSKVKRQQELDDI